MVDTSSSARGAILTGAIVYGVIAAIGGMIVEAASVGPSGIVPGLIIGLIVGVVMGAALGIGTTRLH